MATVAFPQQSVILKCEDCTNDFRYALTRSNNYPHFCPKCRKLRTASNKRLYDRIRTGEPEPAPPIEVRATLWQIPDYVMHPAKIVDAAIRECRGS